MLWNSCTYYSIYFNHFLLGKGLKLKSGSGVHVWYKFAMKNANVGYFRSRLGSGWDIYENAYRSNLITILNRICKTGVLPGQFTNPRPDQHLELDSEYGMVIGTKLHQNSSIHNVQHIILVLVKQIEIKQIYGAWKKIYTSEDKPRPKILDHSNKLWNDTIFSV